ncbi:MAG: bestrophin family protein [Planctomycetaceae bacterium]
MLVVWSPRGRHDGAMIEYNRFSWWVTTFSFRGTALRRALGRIALATGFSILVQAAFEAGEDFGYVKHFSGLDPTGHAVVGSLLGFLIVFRMNASNNRYWEGRSHWGQMINSSRNLVRAGVEYTGAGAELADLVSAYVISVRRTLHGQRDTQEVDRFLTEAQCQEMLHFGNPPTAVAAEVTSWIARHQRLGQLDPQMVRHMEDQLSKLVDAQGGCEKIQKTPLPFAYVAMIKQLILVYLATLPLALCERCGWWSPLMVAVASLGLFGMEEASVEVEDPFGKSDNCLDLETFTLTIARDAGQLVSREERQVRTGGPNSQSARAS